MTELNRYRLALLKYQLSKRIPILTNLLNTNSGFCRHFSPYNYVVIIENHLPILWCLRTQDYGYWFPRGELGPRIELLKQAIKICKRK